MKNSRKITAVFLSLLLIFSCFGLTACGGKKADTKISSRKSSHTYHGEPLPNSVKISSLLDAYPPTEKDREDAINIFTCYVQPEDFTFLGANGKAETLNLSKFPMLSTYKKDGINPKTTDFIHLTGGFYDEDYDADDLWVVFQPGKAFLQYGPGANADDIRYQYYSLGNLVPSLMSRHSIHWEMTEKEVKTALGIPQKESFPGDQNVTDDEGTLKVKLYFTYPGLKTNDPWDSSKKVPAYCTVEVWFNFGVLSPTKNYSASELEYGEDAEDSTEYEQKKESAPLRQILFCPGDGGATWISYSYQ